MLLCLKWAHEGRISLIGAPVPKKLTYGESAYSYVCKERRHRPRRNMGLGQVAAFNNREVE